MVGVGTGQGGCTKRRAAFAPEVTEVTHAMLCASGLAVGAQADGDGTVLECSGADAMGIARAHLCGAKRPGPASGNLLHGQRPPLLPALGPSHCAIKTI